MPRRKLEPDTCDFEEWDGSEWKECERDERSRGLCMRHYNRLRNHDIVFHEYGYDGDLPHGVRLRSENPVNEHWLEYERAWCHYVGEGGACQLPSSDGNGYCQRHQSVIAKWNAPPPPKVVPTPAKRTCTICGRPHYAKGLCRTHYNRQLHAKSDHTDLELLLMAVHPPNDGYSDLEGCGMAEPFRKRVRVDT